MLDKNLIYGILIAILILCIYHIVNNCGCNDGFNVGGQTNRGKHSGKHRGKHGGKLDDKIELEKEIIKLEREILQLNAGNPPIMCNPNTIPKQRCPNGTICPNCGGDACECPSNIPVPPPPLPSDIKCSDDTGKLTNKCPDKQCCSQWGYCGSTTEYCNSKSLDGNPAKDDEPNQRCINDDQCPDKQCCSDYHYCGSGPEYCNGPGPGPLPYTCNVDSYIKNFPSKDASLSPLLSGSTEINIINKTGEICYIHVLGGNEWSHMSNININESKKYYIKNINDSYGVNFKLFNTKSKGCNESLAYTSLFEITTSNNYPSMDISFNAGVNYGIGMIATSNNGKTFKRVAKNNTSPVAYGSPNKDSCQVQQCASANNVIDYNVYPHTDYTDDFKNGNIKKVDVTFFELNSSDYTDTRGPCGNKQCPGYSCEGHNNYNIDTIYGKADICTTSGNNIWCWVDFDPLGVSDQELSNYNTNGGKICPKCDYLKNNKYNKFNIDWNNCN